MTDMLPMTPPTEPASMSLSVRVAMNLSLPSQPALPSLVPI